VPHLRIVDAETFAAVQARRAASSRRPPQEQRRAKRLLSGLLKCGVCGGGMAIRDLVESVVVRRDMAKPGGLAVTITGRLAALLTNGPAGVGGTLVAGAGFEPATSGL
jgi:hypothetical protein